jgi:hypothetical protein
MAPPSQSRCGPIFGDRTFVNRENLQSECSLRLNATCCKRYKVSAKPGLVFVEGNAWAGENTFREKLFSIASQTFARARRLHNGTLPKGLAIPADGLIIGKMFISL